MRIEIMGVRFGAVALRSLAVAAVVFAPRAHAQLPGPEAFAALPAMESPAISADGSRLAFITHSATGDFVVVANVQGMQVTTLIDTGSIGPRSVAWATDSALVVAAGDATGLVGTPGRFEPTSPYGIDLSGEAKMTQLLQEHERPGDAGRRFRGFGGQDATTLIGFDRSAGRVLFPKIDPAEGDRVLWSVDASNDQRRLVDRGSSSTLGWVVDANGAPAFRIDRTPTRGRYTILGHASGRWQPLVEQTDEIPQLLPVALSLNDELVVGLRPQGSDRFGLYALATETGRVGRMVFASDVDVTSVILDPFTNRVVGARTPDAPPTWFDTELGEQQKLLQEAFPGESPVIVSWSRDRNRMIVVSDGDQRVPGVYLYDRSTPSVDQIASTYAALQAAQLPARREYSYSARDGTQIPGYLTRPSGANGPTPLVVLPHRGPASRDIAGFDWLAHFLATRGYAVLQPNFRGSGGYGNAWEFAGFGQWGIGVMQHDLSDGVAALIDAGIADPERVCIVGASYGGYAALAGAVFTPELYRCAAAIGPITDLVAMLGGDVDRRGGGGFRGGPGGGAGGNPTVAYWRQAMGAGDPGTVNERLSAASPAAHAEGARAPILLIHERDDSVVPIEQSRIMQRALEAAGKTVNFVEIGGDDHWLMSPAPRLAVLQALDRFLADHLAR